MYYPKQVHHAVQSSLQMTSSPNSSQNLSFFHGGRLDICNGHLCGTRNAGNNFISVCLQLSVASTNFKLSKFSISCFGAQQHSNLLKEIMGTNPQGAPYCQTTASPTTASSHTYL